MPRKINALIVDDSRTIRKMVMTALDQTGLAKFTFTEAQDGLDALKKFRPGEFDIIFTDMHMPELNGIEFLRELHVVHRQCPPAVMITGESRKEQLLEALNLEGVDALLVKPVDRDRLQIGLKALIDSLPERSGPCAVPHGECVPSAVRSTLAEACRLTLAAAPDDEPVRLGDSVLGMISVLGDVQWSVVFGFAEETAYKAASRFAGYDITPKKQEDMGDAIGELTNIVGGKIKSLLGERNLRITVSLPTVIRASRLQIIVQRSRKTAAHVTHFDSDAGKLWCEVTVGVNTGMVL
ncbi:MAG: response regulator [Phycisphaerae bacterium]|nr:response regulator [Phycisphaerae bacterium]